MHVDNLLKYRSQLMGIAILWVMYRHAGVEITFGFLPLDIFRASAFVSVDMFFMLSGIGLAFSLFKDPSSSHFLSKRLVRILPTFWVCVALFVFVQWWFGKLDVVKDFLTFMGLDFLVFGRYDFWFVPGILLCYLITPLFYRFSYQYSTVVVFGVCSLLALAISVALANSPAHHLLPLTVRLPGFFLGLFVGIAMTQGRSLGWLLNPWLAMLTVTVGTVGMAYIDIYQSWTFVVNTGIVCYFSVLMAFHTCLVLAQGLAWLERFSKLMSQALAFCGKRSLEIYLMQTVLLSVGKALRLQYAEWNESAIPGYLLLVALSVLCAAILSAGLARIDWSRWFQHAVAPSRWLKPNQSL